MGKASRQKKLTELIASHGECSIEQLAKDLDVSEMTIRRDLQAIAKLAASKVQKGQSLLLDSGTTTLALAVALKSKEDLTVVTTSLPIAASLQFCSHINVLLLGGYLQQSSPDLTGALTNSNLDTLCADVAFIGAECIDQNGSVYHRSPESSRLVSKMAKTARQVYIVADHSKLDKTALYRSCRLEDCTGLITDRGANQHFIEELAKKGFQIFTA